MSQKTRTIIYRFRLDNGVEKRFVLKFTHPSLQLLPDPSGQPPEWTRLTFHQCPNCPLDPAQHPHCPIAVNLVDLIDFFRHFVSIEVADISVSTDTREIHKRTAVQYGVSALMGLVMATSGCPIMDKLRPMTFTHLPFSSVDETLYRAVAMYLVAQFLKHKRGQPADWDLKELVTVYEAVGKVNHHFIKRLLSISPKDSSLNALGSLDCFASYTSVSLTDNFFEELEEIFGMYLDEPGRPPA